MHIFTPHFWYGDHKKNGQKLVLTANEKSNRKGLMWKERYVFTYFAKTILKLDRAQLGTGIVFRKCASLYVACSYAHDSIRNACHISFFKFFFKLNIIQSPICNLVLKEICKFWNNFVQLIWESDNIWTYF